MTKYLRGHWAGTPAQRRSDGDTRQTRDSVSTSSHKTYLSHDHCPSSPLCYPWVTMVEELGDRAPGRTAPRGMRQFHSHFFGWTG